MRRLLVLLTALAGCAASHAREALPIDVVAGDGATSDGAPDGGGIGPSSREDTSRGLPILGAASGAGGASGYGDAAMIANAADAATSVAARPLPDAGTRPSADPATNSRDHAMVWIGESERTVTYPEDIDMNPPQRVVLILDALRDMATGTVTFGMGSLPQPKSTDAFYPPGTTPNEAYGWLNAPIEGFDYSVVAATLNGDLLSFAFVPLEFYRDFCALRTSDLPLTRDKQQPFPRAPQLCTCTNGRCVPASGPQRRIDLKVVGDTMEGELSGAEYGSLYDQPIIRLRRVQ